MATGVLGGSDPRADERTILRCVDWLLAHKEPIEAQWWEELHRQATSARSPRDRRHAIEALASRVDPVPKPLIQAVVQGDVSIAWQLPASPSPTPPALSSSNSTTPSPGNGHGLLSSSATDA